MWTHLTPKQSRCFCTELMFGLHNRVSACVSGCSTGLKVKWRLFQNTSQPTWLHASRWHDCFSCNAAWGLEDHACSCGFCPCSLGAEISPESLKLFTIWSAIDGERPLYNCVLRNILFKSSSESLAQCAEPTKALCLLDATFMLRQETFTC